MSLDIGIADKKATVPYPSIRLSFEDDGYYWFCFPFLEQLAKQTGEMIDLYDGAWFHGDDLGILESTLDEITSKAQQMPVSWQECIGHNIGSYEKPLPSEPIYSEVQRNRLIQLLNSFRHLVSEAKREGKWIACLGD